MQFFKIWKSESWMVMIIWGILKFLEFVWAKIYLNQVAPNLADRKELQRARLTQAEERGNKEVTLAKKEGWLLQRYFSLENDKGLSGRLPN